MYQAINRKKIRRARKKHFWRRRVTNLSRPRLCVFRSASHIHAQIIDDQMGKVLASASSVESALKNKNSSGLKMAETIGKLIAERAKLLNVKNVVFDRNGFAYHGRIATLATAARAEGLEF